MSYTNEQIEAAARAAHEVNKTYCREVMDDNTHLQWKDAPDWVRDSAIDGVKAIIDNPRTTPSESHECWLRTKKADGWVYGERKDAEAKTHPCMVPYIQLPLNQRVKDTLFGVTVRAVLGIEHHVAIDSYISQDDIKIDPGRGQIGQ